MTRGRCDIGVYILYSIRRQRGVDYNPFHIVFAMWSVFFLLGLTIPRFFSSASARWKRALEQSVNLSQGNQASASTHMVFDSSSASLSPTITLKADHRSLTLISPPALR
jgi:hypothetical protein